MRPRTADYEMKPMLCDETEDQNPGASFAACQTPLIFRGIFRITKLSNTPYIPKEYAEYRKKAKLRGTVWRFADLSVWEFRALGC